MNFSIEQLKNWEICFFVPESNEIPPHYFSKEWAKRLIHDNPISKPFGGLHNLGNSCFLNSVLQCLAYTPGMERFATSLPNFVYENCQGKACFIHHFGKLCQAQRLLKNCAPHIFFGNLSKISPEMECEMQQDAHEYFIALINKFDDECSIKKGKASSDSDTPMHSFFGGQFLETRKCKNCGNIKTFTSKFLDIIIRLDADTIEKCFESIMGPHDIENSYTCDACEKTCHCTSKQMFEDPPNILVVTMMRFSQNGDKIEKKVDFGPYLDLSPFSKENTTSYYELYGIITHNGHQINRGHFTSYVKTADEHWYLCDDSKIQHQSISTVLETRPYVMFYRRRYDDVISPINVTFGSSRTSPRLRSSNSISLSATNSQDSLSVRSEGHHTSLPSVQLKQRDEAQKRVLKSEDTSHIPNDPMDGFYEEIDDNDMFQDGKLRVSKSFIEKGRVITMNFVCSTGNK